MLKSVSLAAIAVAALSTVPAAAQTIPSTATWRGSIHITSATSACSSNPALLKNSIRLAILRPKLAKSPSTHPNSSLLVTLPNGAWLGIANSNAINGAYKGTYLSAGVTATVNYTGGSYNLTLDPLVTKLTASTEQITIKTGTISKFANIAGCIVTIKGSFFRGV